MPKSTAGPEVISVRIPSRLDLLCVLDHVAQALCGRMELDAEESSKITMSVIEAGTNAIQHGHERDITKFVDIDFCVFADRIEIIVRDLGTGFDVESVNGDITSPEHLFDLRGRGIYIMRQCMDSVEFKFSPSGTVCRMVKQLSRAAKAAEA
ncbi:MAG: ATP-binding protein [Candidatus Eisenbacteria bacterium]